MFFLKKKNIFNQYIMDYENYQLAKINNIALDLDNKYDEDETLFDENDSQFVEFKSSVKEWLMLDDDIITLQKAVKERKVKKDELTPKY